MSCTSHDLATPANIDKITKSSLNSAIIISQVDDKFILAKFPSMTSSSLLVMIDQHAADERIRVEQFWESICNNETPPTLLREPISFSVSGSEITLFETYRQNFANW